MVSLRCNISGAKEMLVNAGSKLHSIWRSNGAPPDSCLRSFTKYVDSLARTHGDPDPQRPPFGIGVVQTHTHSCWSCTETLSEYLGRILHFAINIKKWLAG